MFRLGSYRRSYARLSLLAVALAGCLFASAANAATGSITGSAAGPTPFISNVAATYSGGTLQSIAYQIVPKTGSLTRPWTATYSAQYLTSSGNLNSSSNSVSIPVFGLYSGFTNTVNIYFYFADGTESIQTVSITTAAYTDPCTTLNSPTLTQNRVNTSDLNYDFFILKDICSTNDPAIIDTDGNIRWVGQANDQTSSVGFYNNAIYMSDGSSGILQLLLTTDTMSKIGDYSAAPYNVTFTGHHNIDPGRDGLIVDVNTTTQTEAADLEFNPTTGAVLNFWDLGQIISYTMTKGGNDPTNFVLGTSADWFHNNSTTYNPADNTLIVSSRENFVIAVDYDTPADGQKKIHWILGDTSKAWYTYSSLKALMLTPTNAATLPPIGQHGVSIDHNGYLLLFDDGEQSFTQSPAGNSRNYSAVREYIINASPGVMTATQGPVYYSASPTALDSEICGSVYDVNNTFLVDFPVGTPSGQGTTNGGNVILQGLGVTENLIFNLQYPPNSYCNGGWNAYPIPSNTFEFSGATGVPSFNVSAVPYSLALTAPQTGQVAVSVTHQTNFTGSVALTATGFPAGVTYAFSAVGTSGATLSVTAAAGTVPGNYPITITGTSGSLVSSFTMNLQIGASTAPVASFTLSSAPSSLNLLTGASNTSTITITPVNGFSGNVTLAISGVPAGVTAAFATTPTTNTSVLTLTASSAASLGTSVLTISGTSGTLSATTTLSLTVASATFTSVNMTPSFNVFGIFSDGTSVTNGGLDSASYSYSANLLGTSLTANTVPYSFGTPAQADATSGATVTLPSGNFSTLNFLGTAVFGNQASQTFTVQYTDGTKSTFTQSMSDWGSPQKYAGETIASSMSYREIPGGGTQAGPWSLYAYSFALNNTKTVQSLVLPASRNVVVLAITMGTIATTQSAQTITFPAIATQTVGAQVSLTATSSSGLPVSFASTTPSVCSVSGTTASALATGTCSITASQAGNSTIAAATPVTQSFSVAVSVQSQTIKFGTIPPQTAGTTLTLTATATSGLTVSYTSTTPSVCTVGTGSASLIAVGTCSITASQAGNSTYSAAAPVSQSFSVSAASQTIKFGAISTQTAGTSLTLAATATSGLPVSYTSTTATVCTVNGSSASLIAAGTCSITASQAGNSTYSAAAPVTQSFSVTGESQTINFGAIATQTAGTSLTLAATATSGLPVSYTSTTTSVCTVSGTTASLLVAGSCSITASQAGNGIYSAAAPVSQSFSVTAATKGTFTVSARSTRVTVTPPVCFFSSCFGAVAGTDTITVTPVNGFNAPVTFSISGLPTGIKASFNPASVTGAGSTVVTLTPTSAAQRGLSATLTITASSGTGSSVITAHTSITLSY